jgi:hypothetical protein
VASDTGGKSGVSVWDNQTVRFFHFLTWLVATSLCPISLVRHGNGLALSVTFRWGLLPASKVAPVIPYFF